MDKGNGPTNESGSGSAPVAGGSPPAGGLSSAKREDIWALILAALVMALAMAFPEQVHHLFKKTLFLF